MSSRSCRRKLSLPEARGYPVVVIELEDLEFEDSSVFRSAQAWLRRRMAPAGLVD